MSRIRSRSMVLSATALLFLGSTSCGAGSTTTVPTTTQDPPQTGSHTGSMVDDPVQGLSYATTPDARLLYPSPAAFFRTTGPNGEYDFNPGDVVIFRIGAQSINAGGNAATGILTPMSIAVSANTLQNILTLFQSLDQDGNPFNGILIPAAAASSFTANDPAYFNTDPAVFASTANTRLVAAQRAAGITTGIISPARASTNFLAQFLKLLALKTWGSADATTFTFIRADLNGNYLMGQANPPGGGGTSGVEAGRVTAAGFDRFGWVWSTPTLTLDTNGQWGLSHLLPCERVNIIGSAITGTDCDGADGGSTVEMMNDAAGIVGAWALGSTTTMKTLTMLFFNNGHFAVIDPTGSTAVPSCGGPGVEFGSYTYNAATKILKVSNMTYDTDRCAGLSGTAAPTASGLTFTLATGGATATYNDGTVHTMYRVSQ